jgi:hypothetical protein
MGGNKSHIQGIFCVELSGPATALSISVTCGHMHVLYHSVSQYIIQQSYFSLYFLCIAMDVTDFVPISKVRKSFIFAIVLEREINSA